MKTKFFTLLIAAILAAGANGQRPGGLPGADQQGMGGGDRQGPGQMGPRGGERGHQQRDWFRGVDTNGDGRIDGQELQSASDRTFAELDKNGSGTIEQDEFHMGPPPPRDGQQGMQGQHGGGMQRGQNSPDGDMRPQGRDQGMKNGAGSDDKQLLPPFFFDRQLRDGSLSKADFIIAVQAAFKEMDKNEDGVLTREEARPSRRPEGGNGGEPGGPPPPPNAQFIAAELRFGDKLVQGHPFSADTEIEDTRRLYDGTTATKKMTGAIYRDTPGRTRREQPLEMIGGVQIGGTDGKPKMMVFINDFATRTQTFIDADAKIARTNPINGGPRPEGPGGPVVREGGKSEYLGTKIIEGVKVEGTRDTFQIPAGHLGNDKPIDVVTENWFSPELGVIVMSRHLDPIAGEHTFRLTNIKLGEPSADLFSVPGGYKIENGGGRRPREE